MPFKQDTTTEGLVVFIREGSARTVSESVNKFPPQDMGHQGPKACGNGEDRSH